MCTMDMTKAFDVTMHSLLFSKMLKAGLSAFYVRLLIFIYTEQFANGMVSSLLSSPCIMGSTKVKFLVHWPTASTVNNFLFFWNSTDLAVG